jgi:CCR4-NOT transcription complex subunit 2
MVANSTILLSPSATSSSLSSSFVTPWSDHSTAASLQIEPDFHLPSCYNVQPPPPPQSKVATFSDETLFFIFYSTPRDILQEVAAQEL